MKPLDKQGFSSGGTRTADRELRAEIGGTRPLRVLVCGSRTWTDSDAIRVRLRTFPSGTVVVTGGARGADLLAETVARSLGFAVETWPADWYGLGKRAGLVRNLAMLETRPDVVLAFQQNGSRGTQHTIDQARRRDIRVWVVGDQSA